MHGRPRKPSKPEDAAASAAKAQKLRALQSQFLHNHQNKIYTKEAMELSAKLLEINPESYTAWNYRKLAVEHNLTISDSNPESVESIFYEELRVAESALRQNFKSYGAWYHRKWVLSKGHSSMSRELRLLDKFQKADSRNFHAWNYRRFVATLMNRSEEDELKHTEDMICNNFSNYSAWHNRSVLLSNLLKKKADGFLLKEKVLPEEYEFVHQALFTDPDDQSGWFYHLWLLDQTVKVDSPLLVSSWPAHGTDLMLRGDSCSSSSFTSFYSESGTFPLILYFNQAVEGVNSSTVSVDCELNTIKNLIWKPLLANNSRTAQVWVTQLNFNDVEPKAYPVEVSLGYSHGIISSSGFHYNHPSRFGFRVCVQLVEKDPGKGPGRDVILWRDENFHIYESNSQESSAIVSLDQLSIQNDNKTISAWRIEAIAKEIDHFRELLSLINCKIGKLTLARLLMAHDIMNCPSPNKTSHLEEVLELFSDLMKLDPSHVQYYKDEHSLVLLQQVTSSKESLLKHCFHYRNLTSSHTGNPICLRLNNLSLSLVGSFDKLLWVQMLDLSHNELQSIEGLEAMQLLSFLNLSNNVLSSFTALEPVKSLKLLKVLNISHNEIGAHSIDTTRYLCASPLSHSAGSEWNPGEIVNSGIDVKSYWEAYFILKDLNLTQLDIMGNAISDEKFKSFLIKVLPALKWLDGEQLY